MSINSLNPLPKDTSHSCVFDWPDRAGRPGPPPPSWVPPYPYGPGDDWNPSNPLDNGVPGSNPNPFTDSKDSVKNAYCVYVSMPNPTVIGMNQGIRNYNDAVHGTPIDAYTPADVAISSMFVLDENNAGGGDENHSALCLAEDSASNYRVVLNLNRMVARNPTVTQFSARFICGITYPNNQTFNITVKKVTGVFPTVSVIPNASTFDYSFSGYTALTTFGPFTHFVSDPSIPIFSFLYDVPSGICYLYYP